MFDETTHRIASSIGHVAEEHPKAGKKKAEEDEEKEEDFFKKF
jgi:hypothetical protein